MYSLYCDTGSGPVFYAERGTESGAKELAKNVFQESLRPARLGFYIYRHGRLRFRSGHNQSWRLRWKAGRGEAEPGRVAA